MIQVDLNGTTSAVRNEVRPRRFEGVHAARLKVPVPSLAALCVLSPKRLVLQNARAVLLARLTL